MEPWQQVLRKQSIASLDALVAKFGAEHVPDLERLRRAAENFEFRISPAMVDLIKSPGDPIWRQYVPDLQELEVHDGLVDSLAEDANSPVSNITHRYPDRALFLVSPVCAAYCRFCTRSEEHTSELQSQSNLVCRLLLEKKKTNLCLCMIQTRTRLSGPWAPRPEAMPASLYKSPSTC